MSAGAVALTPGTRLVYDGDLVEVVELDGARGRGGHADAAREGDCG